MNFEEKLKEEFEKKFVTTAKITDVVNEKFFIEKRVDITKLPKEYIDFILQSLSDYKKELRKEIKGKRITKVYQYSPNLTKDEWDARISWWNNAINEILSLLQKDKEVSN